jgi:hypothetical protein
VPTSDNGQYADSARIDALERWRLAVDDERGRIMADLGSFGTLLKGIGVDIQQIRTRLESISEKLEERPSHAELKSVERDIASIRAKAKIPLRELEVTGPGGVKFKLLGFSGVTIILALCLIVTFFVLWILK